MARNVESRTITIIPSEWEEFGRVCDKNGLDRSKLIRNWITKWIDLRKKGIKINVDIP